MSNISRSFWILYSFCLRARFILRMRLNAFSWAFLSSEISAYFKYLFSAFFFFLSSSLSMSSISFYNTFNSSSNSYFLRCASFILFYFCSLDKLRFLGFLELFDIPLFLIESLSYSSFGYMWILYLYFPNNLSLFTFTLFELFKIVEKSSSKALPILFS